MTPRRPTPHHPSAFCALLVGLLAAMGLVGCPDTPATSDAPLAPDADVEKPDVAEEAAPADVPLDRPDARRPDVVGLDAPQKAEVPVIEEDLPEPDAVDLDRPSFDVELTLLPVEDPSAIYQQVLGGPGMHVRCRPGEIADCACLDGREGRQTCEYSGAFSACVCVTPRARVVGPPRLVSPLTHFRVSSQRPSLHWVVPAGTTRVRVELCGDRPCSRLLLREETTSLDVWQPERPLAPGMVFWRVQALNAAGATLWSSPTWLFYVGRRDAPYDTALVRPIDVNGDGYDDVLVTRSAGPGAQSYSVHFGAPDGLRPAPEALLQIPESQLRGRRLWTTELDPWSSDFNGDGFTDVLLEALNLANTPGVPAPRAYIFYGAATGALRRYVESFPVSNAGNDLSAAYVSDYNGDGFLDAVSYNGRGLVGGASGLSLVPVPTGLSGLSRDILSYLHPTGDIDRDGRDDLASGFPRVFYGGADFAFTPEPGLTAPASPDPPNASGDLNGDRHADLATREAEGRGAPVVDYGSPDGLFSGLGMFALDRYPVPAGTTDRLEGTTRMFLGDVNGDGLSDLLYDAIWGIRKFGTTSPCPSWLTLYRFDGNVAGVSLVPNVMFRTPCRGWGFEMRAVGDYDGDGFTDVLLDVWSGTQMVAVLRGTPEGWGQSIQPIFSCPSCTLR